MPTIIYEGHTITCTDNLMFAVSGPQFDENENYQRASAGDAKAEIEKRIAAEKKQAAVTHRTSIPMLDRNGGPITVRGINRNGGSTLGYEKIDPPRVSLPDIFPPVPWIRAALQERAKLLDQAQTITLKVWKYGLNERRSYGRIGPNEYEKAYSALLAEIENKTAAAQAAAPQGEG